MHLSLRWMLLMASTALLFGQQVEKDHPYGGPRRIGAATVAETASVKGLLARLGSPSSATDTFCFRSSGRDAYMWFSRRAHDSRHVGEVFLSEFPNCHDRPLCTTAEPLRSWKTERGIGLGSSSADVIRQYGPAARIAISGTAYRHLIQGDYTGSGDVFKPSQRPELGDTALAYSGPSNDLLSAAFGIRNGRVVWISLCNSE